MSKTYYETLGVKPTATNHEIKSAYRKLVLRHHPDRSKDPGSAAVFMAAQTAYEALSDELQRKAYDDQLALEAKRAAERDRENIARAARSRNQPQANWRNSSSSSSSSSPRASKASAADIQRLTMLFSRGRHSEAETLARQLAQKDPRHPVPYAVLGDIARLRGHLTESARMYAYAAQFEPNNPVYQRRYEEILSASRVVDDGKLRSKLQPQDAKILGPLAGAVIVFLCGVYVSVGVEAPIVPSITPISTWTLGLFIMQFLSGVVVGASLSMGNLLDRFFSVSVGSARQIGPNLALGLVAVANFWAAAVLYLLMGAVQRAFNFSSTRLIGGVALATVFLSIASIGNPILSPMQVLTWGGNLVYMGALVGWMVADAFRV